MTQLDFSSGSAAFTVDVGQLRGRQVRLAPFGAEDLGMPQPCMVYSPSAGGHALITERGQVLTARSERRLRAMAERRGLRVSAALWIP